MIEALEALHELRKGNVLCAPDAAGKPDDAPLLKDVGAQQEVSYVTEDLLPSEGD